MRIAAVLLLLGALCSGADAADFAGLSKPMPTMCDNILHAARVGVSSGKIVLIDKSDRVVAGKIGDAKVMPVFDVNLHGASILARVTF